MARKILIIDDAEDLIELTRRFLESRGYEVKTMTQGAGAVQAIKDDPPDLIIMDMLLPDKDGSEICTELKSLEATKNIPVILSSGQFLQDADLTSQGYAKPDDYLMKPFEIDDLLSKIKKFLP